MRNIILQFATLVILFSFSEKICSQSIANRVDSIIELKKYVKQNIDNQDVFFVIEIDGFLPTEVVKKRVLGVFNKTVSQSFGGNFSETRVLKDSLLVSKRVWKRTFLDSQKNNSTMSFKEFLYDKEAICYYFEVKKYERKNKEDSLIYEVEAFFNKDKIIKDIIKGNLGQDTDIFLKELVLSPQ